MTAARMKGDGFYDAHSQMQLSIIESTAALIKEAVERIPLPAGVFGIIDYGCAGGRNSVASVKLALDAVRRRDSDLVISITHNDLPTNDFNQLFANLSDAGGYGDGERTFVFASGKTFYGQVVPDGSAHLGYSSSSLHWLSEAPPNGVRRHVLHWGGSADESALFQRIAANDWLCFLEARARELVAGGRLVLTMGARLDPDCGDTASYTGEWVTAQIMVDLLDELLRELVEEGVLANDQYESFAYPLYHRNRKELLAPFADPDSPVVDAYSVELIDVRPMPCPLYARYLGDGDPQTYGKDLTAQFRAFSEPVLLCGLFNVSERRLAERRRLPELKILDQLWEKMGSRIAADPDSYTFNPITAFLVLSRR